MVEQIEGDIVSYRISPSNRTPQPLLPGETPGPHREEVLLDLKSSSFAALRGLSPPAVLSERGTVTPDALLRFGAVSLIL